MNNDIRNHHPSNPNIPYQQADINNKLATLLAVIVSFQQKIQILRVKLCGHPNFSPQLYYRQIDREEKGYIDLQDIVKFIKKSKPTFNIDHRYLKALFIKLNQDKDGRVPSDRLTYFGYLNIIKPYFQKELARDVLMRDSIAAGNQINLIVKKLLEDLVCAIYVCAAEHERVKQLIIVGDVQYGGNDTGSLYNIYQLLQIIKNGAININNQRITSVNSIQLHVPSATNIRSGTNLNIRQIKSDSRIITQKIEHENQNPNVKSKVSISSNISKSKHTQQGILDVFYSFISKFSQFQIQRSQMKYLLAYLMCHQYMVTQQKYLTVLFMPVCAQVYVPNRKQRMQFQNAINNTNNVAYVTSGQGNFLGYVHPNSMTNEQIQMQRMKQTHKINNRNLNPQIRRQNKQSSRANKIHREVHQKIVVEQPRILINPPHQSRLHTPILQKFLRQSKVLKNMSRYNSVIRQQSSQYSPSSAFIQQGQTSRQRHGNYLNPTQEIGRQHKQRPINKDFNLEDVLSNSNLHRSQYYSHLNQRAYIKDQPLRPADLQSPNRYLKEEETSGILNNFMLR